MHLLTYVLAPHPISLGIWVGGIAEATKYPRKFAITFADKYRRGDPLDP